MSETETEQSVHIRRPKRADARRNYDKLVSRWVKSFAVAVGVRHAYSYRCCDRAD
jgi:hypothetical protein